MRLYLLINYDRENGLASGCPVAALTTRGGLQIDYFAREPLSVRSDVQKELQEVKGVGERTFVIRDSSQNLVVAAVRIPVTRVRLVRRVELSPHETLHLYADFLEYLRTVGKLTKPLEIDLQLVRQKSDLKN